MSSPSAMEEDASETDAVNAARTAAINGLKTKANSIVQAIKLTEPARGMCRNSIQVSSRSSSRRKR